MTQKYEQQIAVLLPPVTKSDEASECKEQVADLCLACSHDSYYVSLHSSCHMTCELPLTGCSPRVNL